ncbi:MAG TPA: hypothetical protein VFQ53_42475 [Kofleriaceae bacterium]|nr:hypothetical protein [Kofleriaceae bacterium]
MKGPLACCVAAWLCAGFAACGAGGDGDIEGARAHCAYGGALTDCPDAERTVEAVCWRLVDCGAIAVDSDDRADWGDCVDGIAGLTDDRQRLVINCIAASTCDELRVSDRCFDFGND